MGERGEESGKERGKEEIFGRERGKREWEIDRIEWERDFAMNCPRLSLLVVVRIIMSTEIGIWRENQLLGSLSEEEGGSW